MVTCRDPGPLPNADRSGFGLKYGQVVIYSCKRGFARRSGAPGDISIECKADGEWHGWDMCQGEQRTSLGQHG